MTTLFFAGLRVAALCSSTYHLQPDDTRLAVDRVGMLAALAARPVLAAIPSRPLLHNGVPHLHQAGGA